MYELEVFLHHWQIELNSLTQHEHERVETGLKDIYTALVTIVVPKSLSEAVAAARRVKVGNYYGQHNAEVAKQIRIGSELSDFKKRIDEMALNYATLTGKIKDTPQSPEIRQVIVSFVFDAKRWDIYP
ncbi:37948_t:CDS:2, partial [Gigaspora margarita]